MSGSGLRKQLLAVVLKETILRAGLPPGSVALELFRTVERSGQRSRAIHVRLVVRESDPTLQRRMLDLERDFRMRLGMIDYRCAEWLQGISWQFDLLEDNESDEAPVQAATRLPLTSSAGRATIQGRPSPSLRRKAREEIASRCTYAYTAPAALE